MNLYFMLILFISHYVGDFLLQRRKVAVNKHSDMACLLEHTVIIFIVTLAAMFMSGREVAAVIAAVLYAILHGIQDRFIWRSFNKKKIENNWTVEDPEFSNWFFKYLGLDQMLHMIILFTLSSILLT